MEFMEVIASAFLNFVCYQAIWIVLMLILIGVWYLWRITGVVTIEDDIINLNWYKFDEAFDKLKKKTVSWMFGKKYDS